jgi:hypothetical protein
MAKSMESVFTNSAKPFFCDFSFGRFGIELKYCFGRGWCMLE